MTNYSENEMKTKNKIKSNEYKNDVIAIVWTYS
jgi:hypothetical protein